MSHRWQYLTLALAVGWPAPARAQLPDWVNQILIAADLPVSTDQARKEGAASDEIRQVLDVMVTEKVPADEARRVIDEERASRREHGPVDNFGAFVQARLRAGLRGRELAAAIRAEHAARGKGKDKNRDQDRDRDEDRDRDRDRDGEPRDSMHRDRPDTRPAPGDRRPEDKGKPADRPGNSDS